jgi:prepilin peptidase CpaA
MGAFVTLAALFALGIIGGGDVKLLAALALWFDPSSFLKLIVIMALAGGVISLVFGGIHVLRQKGDKMKTKVMVPYGLAISFAGLWVMANQYLPALQSGTSLGSTSF